VRWARIEISFSCYQEAKALKVALIKSFTSPTGKGKCRIKHDCMQRERDRVHERERMRNKRIIVATERIYCKEREGEGTRPKIKSR
jgi:hypothetical protein